MLEHIAQLEATLRDLDHVSDGDTRALMAIDERFHELFYQASDNEFLAGILSRLHALSLRLWWLVLGRLEDLRGEIAVHREIIPVLKAGDEARAEALMQQHIAGFQRQIKAVL